MNKKPYPLIGIIAVTTPSAAIFAQRFVEVAAKKGLGTAHPEYIIHAHSTAEFINLVNSEDWYGVTRLVMDSVAKLSSLGARLFIMPSHLPHYAWRYIAFELNELNSMREKPIVFFNLIKNTIEQCKKKQFKSVLLLSTAETIKSNLYKRAFEEQDVKVYVPNSEDVTFLDRYNKNYLAKNENKELYIKQFFQIINTLYSANHFDAIILSCTELPLILSNELLTQRNSLNNPIELIDTTDLLANNVLEQAIEMSQENVYIAEMAKCIVE